MEGMDALRNRLRAAFEIKKQRLMMAMESVMIEMVNYIKEQGPWTDRTANLRNSVSYAGPFYGTADEVSETFETMSGTYRDTVGRTRDYQSKKTTLHAPAIGGFGSTITGVIYAGMEYAIFIEYKEGYWVLSGAMEEFRPKLVEMIRKRMQ